ncbi:MAG TPA: methionyl-tRNA formyltransferase [Acidimicrobiales bacterium]
MRVAIIGQQPFGKAVLEALLGRGDDVAGVFCAPEGAGSRPDALRAAAEALGLNVIQLPSLRGDAAHVAIRDLDVDLAVMAYVLQFAPQSLLEVPRHGTIQYHPSLLPKHRGPSSINWPIIKGETYTGLTIFRPTDGLDEGPIILQKVVDITPEDTVGTLYFNRLFPLGVDALVEAADLVFSGRHRERSQDENEATYEGWCRDESARIDWNHHGDLIYNLIRGCDPSPGAWTRLEGEKLYFFDAKKTLTRRFADVVGQPGEVLGFDEERALVAVRGGVLEIARVRIGSDPKGGAATVLRSIGVTAGTVMDS